jgi:formylglycine-generating enzyme required for sulfatase activity
MMIKPTMWRIPLTRICFTLLVLLILLACQTAYAQKNGVRNYAHNPMPNTTPPTQETTPPVQTVDPYYQRKLALEKALAPHAAEIDKAQKPTAQMPFTKPNVTTVTGSVSLAQAKKPRKNRVSTSNSTQNVIPPVQANADSKAAQTPLPETTPATQETTPPVQAVDPCNTADPNSAPTMVAIRPGRFTMGSPKSEQGRTPDESPLHQVTIPKPFAISRCEITVGQFKQFIQETGYKTSAETDGKGCYVWNAEKNEGQQQVDKQWNNPGFTQTDEHPVICVSWSDAQRYVDWLSQRTGAVYRLPTEAEWEYAARADTETASYYGKESQCDYANGLGQEAKGIVDKNWRLADCRDGYIYTAPVAHFKPNLFGLYDMLGNVWEWTLDCWHEDYKLAPYDGTAWPKTQGGDCDRQVIRGGSWGYDPQDLRSAIRLKLSSVEADYILGFRIARAL